MTYRCARRHVAVSIYDIFDGHGHHVAETTSLGNAEFLVFALNRRSLFEDVGDFHARFELPRFPLVAPKKLEPDVQLFRLGFLLEELEEFNRAWARGTLADAADALCDLVYVALGTAHLMGLPFDRCWDEVQRANLSKVRAEGADDPRSKRRHHLDIVKPVDFVPPDHDKILASS